MAFNDGDPIDAAQLTALETKVNTLEGKIPQVGAPGANVVPQMYGGISGLVVLSPGKDVTFPIDYSAAKLTSTPSSVILTPAHASKATHADFYVISAGPTSAQCGAYISASAASFSTQFYYFVVCN